MTKGNAKQASSAHSSIAMANRLHRVHQQLGLGQRRKLLEKGKAAKPELVSMQALLLQLHRIVLVKSAKARQHSGSACDVLGRCASSVWRTMGKPLDNARFVPVVIQLKGDNQSKGQRDFGSVELVASLFLKTGNALIANPASRFVIVNVKQLTIAGFASFAVNRR